jgi:hypothetical protein
VKLFALFLEDVAAGFLDTTDGLGLEDCLLDGGCGNGAPISSFPSDYLEELRWT